MVIPPRNNQSKQEYKTKTRSKTKTKTKKYIFTAPPSRSTYIFSQTNKCLPPHITPRANTAKHSDSECDSDSVSDNIYIYCATCAGTGHILFFPKRGWQIPQNMLVLLAWKGNDVRSFAAARDYKRCREVIYSRLVAVMLPRLRCSKNQAAK